MPTAMSSDWSQDPDVGCLAVDKKKLQREQTGKFDGKKACWVPDEKEGFVRADIQSTKGEEVSVKIEKTNEVSTVHAHLFLVYFRLLLNH